MRYAVLFLVVLVCGCDERVSNQRKTFDLTYTKDYRTGLCFAVLGLGYNHGVVTNVPCSPEVEALIANTPSVEK
jgi:hypothetical protein